MLIGTVVISSWFVLFFCWLSCKNIRIKSTHVYKFLLYYIVYIFFAALQLTWNASPARLFSSPSAHIPFDWISLWKIVSTGNRNASSCLKLNSFLLALKRGFDTASVGGGEGGSSCNLINAEEGAGWTQLSPSSATLCYAYIIFIYFLSRLQ